MKKIPTLFTRLYENHRIVECLPEYAKEFEWVFRGEGVATIKYDGSCCAIIDGELYKRYDAKKGKKPPEGAIPCCPPDPVTGHHPHWVKCDRDNPADKWFWAACDLTGPGPDGTYEAVGKHFNGNPYNEEDDLLVKHGRTVVEIDRTFEGIKRWLQENNQEGIVFWKDGEPQCKIKRTDFGLPWPVEGAKL